MTRRDRSPAKPPVPVKAVNNNKPSSQPLAKPPVPSVKKTAEPKDTAPVAPVAKPAARSGIAKSEHEASLNFHILISFVLLTYY